MSISLSLSKRAPKVKKDEVLSELVLSYTGTDVPSIEEVFGVTIPNDYMWKKVDLDVKESNYKMVFDSMDQKVVTLRSIKISKKETKNGIVYKTDISVTKDVDSYDQIMDNSFYKRKEANDDGKMELVYYEVEFTKM